MLYELFLKEIEDYLEVRIEGERTMAAVITAAREITAICKESNIYKVLIDVREFKGRLELSESYDIISGKFPKMKNNEINLQVAIVDDVKFKIKYRFFETVAQNRGFNVRLFGNVEKAVKWLR